MIVLTDGKDASSAYCLTTALYCPLPGQYLAIARHKTIRRERKSPLSFLLFTLHQIVWNPDKHRGSESWRVAHHSSPLFTTLHLRIAHGIETEAWPVRSGAETTFLCPTDFTDLHRFFRVKGGWRVGEEWWRGERTLHPIKATYTQQLTPLRWRVKSIFETGGLSLQVTAKSV